LGRPHERVLFAKLLGVPQYLITGQQLHRQKIRCRVVDVVFVATRRSARIASRCSAINVKIGSSLSAGKLHSSVVATGAVTAAAARHAGKQAAAQASFAKGALPPAVMWIGKADRVLPAEALAQLRQTHGLIVWDVEDDALHRGDALCSTAAISCSNSRR